ncbi:hypothetical protein [Halorussus halophilus]|uniref:hypothetical protein n=1 Tax=Halorussus halophilus TaxID=2650975 RepID=UPI001300D78A|nr:hypothetical protein [Halorussus halophilus]
MVLETDSASSGRYWQFLAGYVVLSVGGGLGLVLLAGRSSAVMAGIEILVTLVVLALASVATVPALYRDANALDRRDAEWNPDWRKYVAFVLGGPVLAFLVVNHAGGPKVAVFVAAISLVVGTFETCAVYLYNRHRHVGLPS